MFSKRDSKKTPSGFALLCCCKCNATCTTDDVGIFKSVIVILSAYGPVVTKNREINVLRSMKRYSLPSFTYECVLCATVCKCVCIFNVNKFTTYFMRVLCCYSGWEPWNPGTFSTHSVRKKAHIIMCCVKYIKPLLL